LKTDSECKDDIKPKNKTHNTKFGIQFPKEKNF